MSDAIVAAFNEATTWEDVLAAINDNAATLLGSTHLEKLDYLKVQADREQALGLNVYEIKTLFGDFICLARIKTVVERQIDIEYAKFEFVFTFETATTAEDMRIAIERIQLVREDRESIIQEWSSSEDPAVRARAAELEAEHYTIVLRKIAARLDDGAYLDALAAQLLAARQENGPFDNLDGLIQALDDATDVLASQSIITSFNEAADWEALLAAIKSHASALLDPDHLAKLDQLSVEDAYEQAVGLGVAEIRTLFGNFTSADEITAAVEKQIDMAHARFAALSAINGSDDVGSMAAALSIHVAHLSQQRQKLITDWLATRDPEAAIRAAELEAETYTTVLREVSSHLGDETYLAELAFRMQSVRQDSLFDDTDALIAALDMVDRAIDADHDAVISGASRGSLTEDGTQSIFIGTLLVADEDWGENVFQVVATADLEKEYGTFTFDETAGVWSFTIDSTAAQSLKKDQAVQQTLTVRSADGTASQIITVTVTGMNDAPVAASTGNAASDNEGTTISGTLPAGFDIDGDALTYELVEEVSGLTLDADGSFSYVPASNATGTFTFKYRVVDANGVASEEQSFRITVKPINDNPESSEAGNEASGNEDTTINGQVPAGRDVDGDELTYELVEEVEGLTFYNDGSFIYVPAENFHGEVTFEYRVVDENEGKSAARTFTLAINPVNDAPVAAAEGNNFSGNEDMVITGSVPFGSDVDDGGSLKYELIASMAGLTLNANGTFSYDPPADFNGVVEFQYRVVDAAGAKSAPQTFKLTVNAVNDAPRDILLSNSSVFENTAVGAEIGRMMGSDPEGGAFTYTLLEDAGGRFALDSATGLLTVASDFALDYEQATSHTIRVQVKDSAGAAYEEIFTIDVGDVQGETITGTSTHDVIMGNLGDDVLKAGAGNDTVSGGSGNDRLAGGAGKDTLTGGSGKDAFVFATKDTGTSKGTADTIIDFRGRDGDRIDLKLIDADVKKRGDQKFSFVGKDDAFTKAGQVRYEKTKKETYIYLNTDKDKAAEGVIKLKGAMDLQKGWFVL